MRRSKKSVYFKNLKLRFIWLYPAVFSDTLYKQENMFLPRTRILWNGSYTDGVTVHGQLHNPTIRPACSITDN